MVRTNIKDESRLKAARSGLVRERCGAIVLLVGDEFMFLLWGMVNVRSVFECERDRPDHRPDAPDDPVRVLTITAC
jgi:hypothetical protein